MSKPVSWSQFVRHYGRKCATEYRDSIAFPGSQHFDLADMEARLLADLQTDPIAKFYSMPQMAKLIINSVDRSRRPLIDDAAEADLFRNEHKWIVLGGKMRVRWSDATTFDLTVYLGVINEQEARQQAAARKRVALIQQALSLCIKTGSPNVGTSWQVEFGWTSSDDSGADIDDEPDDGEPIS